MEKSQALYCGDARGTQPYFLGDLFNRDRRVPQSGIPFGLIVTAEKGRARFHVNTLFHKVHDEDSGLATTAAAGMLMIPAMIQRGYVRSYVSDITASSGGPGIVIPRRSR